MGTTYIRVSELNLGKVIAEDIFVNTQVPIVYKDTKVTHEHLHIFKVFNIRTVLIYIEEDVKLGLNELDLDVDLSNYTNILRPANFNSFEKLYNDAVSSFKKDFKNWSAGSKVDIPKIRSSILPLIEKVLENRAYIFDLNSYSNPKDYLYHHCIAIGLIAGVLAQKLGLDRGSCIQMALAGTLADCGMSKIPLNIREKKQALTSLEFAEVRKHPIYSYSMIKDFPILKKQMKEAVLKHHERLDGSGYPTGSKIASNVDYSQVLAVADVFHAMTSERLYRMKKSPFLVVEMIKESEFGKFDIKVVQAMMDIIVELPIGTKVELSNLERGEVMFINKFVPTRPLVKLNSTGEIIDLSTNRFFHISRIITKEYL